MPIPSFINCGEVSDFLGKPRCKITETLLEQIYKQSWRKLYYICYSRLQNTEQSMDIVQNVFRSVWEKRNDLQIDDNFEIYLVQAVKWQLSNYYRDKAIEEKSLQEFTIHQQTTSDETEAQFEYKVLCQQIKTLVDQLPDRCREVYKLSREEGLKNPQIAQKLLITEKTVENQLTKALSYLRINLSKKN